VEAINGGFKKENTYRELKRNGKKWGADSKDGEYPRMI